MGSSNAELNKTISTMKPEADLKPHPPIFVEKPALHLTETELSPSASTSFSSSNEPSHHDEKSGTSRAADEPSDDVATTTEAPVSQEIERPPLASHESIFSIHMEDYLKSYQMFGYLAHEHEDSAAADMRKGELGIAEATMKEVIKECEAHQNNGVIRPPRRTKTTTTSFAFSVIGGEAEKVSARTDGEPVKSPAATGNAARCKLFACFTCFKLFACFSCCKWC